MDVLSDHGNLDVRLVVRISTSIEREFGNVINRRNERNDFESLLKRDCSSRANAIRNSDSRSGPTSHDGFAGSFGILSSNMNARLFHDRDSLMNVMQAQIKRAVSSAIHDKVLPKILNVMGNLLLVQIGIGKERPRMSVVFVMFGKTLIQNLHRQHQGPRVILGKKRTVLLIW